MAGRPSAVHSRATRITGVGHSRLEPALADHVQELHLDVHAGLGVEHVAVDDGAHTVAAGDEPLSLQRGQDVPQLCTADAQLLCQDAFPGQTLAVGVLAAFHVPQQLGADGLGLGGMGTHGLHL